MAQFCLATKMAPSEYRKLTLREMNMFVQVLADRGPDLGDVFDGN
jgi:hypothetical protein